MALVESVALEVGQMMPDFELATPEGVRYTQKSLMGEKAFWWPLPATIAPMPWPYGHA